MPMRDPEARLIIFLSLAGLSAMAIFDGCAAEQVPDREDWVVSAIPSMNRIGRLETVTPRTGITVHAARDEYAAFQIVLGAGKSAISDAALKPSDLTGPPGEKIPGGNMTIYREHYIQVTSPSPDPGSGNRPLGRGWYPDALIPLSAPGNAASRSAGLAGAPLDVAPETNQPFWVDIYVPRNAAPGDYRGTVEVTAGTRQANIRVALQVWNFSLPLTPTLQSSFGMHEPSLTDRRTHELLLNHRVMPESVNPADAPDLEARFGMNTTGLRFWSHFNKNRCGMDPSPSPAQIAAVTELYPPDLPLHLYAADEIDSCPQVFEKVRQWAAAMHRASSRIQNLVTVAPVPALFTDGTGTGRPGVDIWALLPKVWDRDAAGIAEAQARGGKIWAYTALVQEAYSPKWEIDFAPVNYRILPGFLAQSMGLSGILYWRVELWTRAPYNDLRGYSIDGHYYPGEGMLVYPGAPAGVDYPLPSMRLKWIRAGVQDYEYVAILKRLDRSAWALDATRPAAGDWRHWTRDPQLVEATHDRLGEEIDRLSNQGRP
jgi:hypothetical protein